MSAPARAEPGRGEAQPAAPPAGTSFPPPFSPDNYVLTACVRAANGSRHEAARVDVTTLSDTRIDLAAHFAADAQPSDRATLAFYVAPRGGATPALLGRVRADALPRHATSAEYRAPSVTWQLACLATLGRLWRTERALLGTHPINVALAALAGFNPAIVEWRGTLSSQAGPGANHGVIPVVGWGVYDPARDPALARGHVTLATRRYAANAADPSQVVVEAGTRYELAIEVRYAGVAGERWTRVAAAQLPPIPRGGGVCGAPEAHVSFASAARERRRTIVQMVLQVPREAIRGAIE